MYAYYKCWMGVIFIELYFNNGGKKNENFQMYYVEIEQNNSSRNKRI